jgi:hypothetical protein
MDEKTRRAKDIKFCKVTRLEFLEVSNLEPAAT